MSGSAAQPMSHIDKYLEMVAATTAMCPDLNIVNVIIKPGGAVRDQHIQGDTYVYAKRIEGLHVFGRLVFVECIEPVGAYCTPGDSLINTTQGCFISSSRQEGVTLTHSTIDGTLVCCKGTVVNLVRQSTVAEGVVLSTAAQVNFDVTSTNKKGETIATSIVV
jgi:hypothetical protein